MKQGWELKRLGEIASIKGGKRVPKGYRLETEPTNYPYIRVTDFNDDGSIDLSDIHYINKTVYEQIKNYSISTKDLYISIAGTIGKAGIIPEELNGANLTENACKLVFKIDVDPKYVYYFTQTADFLKQAVLNTRVAAMPKLALSRLSTISLLFPKSFTRQQQIVSILDKSFAAIAKAKANAEQNLKNAKEVFESYLQTIFANKGEGWEEKTLGDVCEFTQGIQRDVKLQSETQKAAQVRFLRIIDFTQGNEPSRYIDNPGVKYILNADDVSLVRYGASTGFVCRGLEGALANNLFRVIPKSKKVLTNDFLFIFLNSPIFQNVIKESMNGAAMPAISFGLIKDIPFPIISLTAQQTIVSKLDALSTKTKRLEAIYQQKVVDLEELKKSVLQKAFNGEL